jgi:hypothetical protein
MSNRTITIKALVERELDSNPRFVVVPGDQAHRLGAAEEAMIDCWVSGEHERRTLQRLDPHAFRVELTEDLCRRAEVDVGDQVEVVLGLADPDTPAELEALLHEQPRMRQRWEDLSDARRRDLAEHVRRAPHGEPRERRAQQVLRRLR